MTAALLRVAGLGLAAGMILGGCKPTYPTGSAEQSIARICEQEYKVAVQVKRAGTTLGVLMVMPHILMNDLSFSDKALNRLENVMLTTSRVLLSSEFPYEFFVVSILDSSTGVQVSFVRYLKDIRRLIMDDISRSDYFQRMLIESEFYGPLVPGAQPEYRLREYTLGGFLARQIAERLQASLQLNMVAGNLFEIIHLEGRIVSEQASPRQPRGREAWIDIRVHFQPGAPQFADMGSPQVREDLMGTFRETAAKILRRYEFTGYEGIRVTDARGPLLAEMDRSSLQQDNANHLMQFMRTLKGQ